MSKRVLISSFKNRTRQIEEIKEHFDKVPPYSRFELMRKPVIKLPAKQSTAQVLRRRLLCGHDVRYKCAAFDKAGGGSPFWIARHKDDPKSWIGSRMYVPTLWREQPPVTVAEYLSAHRIACWSGK